MTQFEARGGEIVCQRINDLEELSDFDVVVNCSGLGANQLVGDETVQPLRGQVMRVWAPWLRICLLDDEDDGNYVLPNMDSVVLGGTHQQGDWDTVKCHFCSIFPLLLASISCYPSVFVVTDYANVSISFKIVY